jgi:hypothetical protein
LVTAEQIGRDLLDGVARLGREVEEVYTRLVMPTWGSGLHGFPDALYGYVLGVFSRIDVASAYWRGGDTGNQTERLVGFMETYFGRPRDLCAVAVQMWRHKLVHTSQPRPLRHPKTGVVYRWLLHWGEHLPESQHFTLSGSDGERILNLGLTYLISDLRRGVEAFYAAASRDPSLQAGMENFERELRDQQLRLL